MLIEVQEERELGFYVRKSVKLGPFRFNLSKSGVGVSTGFRGFRVGTGPRGNYVHMGRGGLYYRKTLPSGDRSRAPRAPSSDPGFDIPLGDQDPGHEPLQEIESADTAQIVDSSSVELVEELNAKRKKWRIAPMVLVAGLVVIWYVAAMQTPSWVLPTILIATLALAMFAAYQDRLRKTTVVLYDIEDDYEIVYQNLHEAFERMRKGKKKWHMIAEGKVTDKKRNAGASTIVKRNPINLTLALPGDVKTNVHVPCIPVGKQQLYFFPDRVLVFEKNAVGAVSYENLNVEAWSQRFIEDEAVPKDSQIVDHTWRYVNKNGGPDRRFNDNKRLPIVLYEAISMRSDTGLNEEIQLSRAEVGGGFVQAIRSVAQGYRTA